MCDEDPWVVPVGRVLVVRGRDQAGLVAKSRCIFKDECEAKRLGRNVGHEG